MTTKRKTTPGTSDEGQLTASQSPFLPPAPKQPPYEPPPRPGSGETGPALAASPALAERKLGYRALAATIEVTQADIAAAAEAAAKKAR